MSEKLKPRELKEFYIEALNACNYEIARININIELYSSIPAETVVGDRALSAQSSDKCTAAEAVEINQQNLKVFTDKRDAILRLLD